MIKFPCKCGNLFNVPDDMAGGMLQCPRCGLLNDVPSLSDLANLREDGTFKLADHSKSAAVHDEHAVAEMHVAFSRHTTDALGREKDLRPDEETFRAAGETVEELVSLKPKYDPATGELVRPLDLKSGDPEHVLPVDDSAPALAALPVAPIIPAKPISYATTGSRLTITPATLLLELFQPPNAIVLFFVFLFYIIAGLTATMFAVGSLFFHFSLQILNVPVWLILAHYGSVIEETGLEARDELPRPLRNLDVSQDLLNPFVSVITAGLICYAPAIILGIPRIPLEDHPRLCLVLIAELLGSFIFPAVLLTTVTGSTLANLRPDRVARVILQCGGDYILAVGVYLISLHVTMFYLLPGGAQWMDPKLFLHLQSPLVVLPALAVCVYLTHYFCWLLGLIYRINHDKFPWILQRHISTRHQPTVFLPPRRY